MMLMVNFKKKYKLIVAAFFMGLICVNLATIAKADSDDFILPGRILLQVENNGQAWYVDPLLGTRAYLGRPADAFRVMRSFGLGVSNADMTKIRSSNLKRKKYSGRILLQVEEGGAAYYLNPADLTLNYLGRPADAFLVMRTLALGISNKDLVKIAINPNFKSYVVSPNVLTGGGVVAAATLTSGNSSISTTTKPVVSNWQIIAANTCSSFSYTDWSACSVWGYQTRSISSSFPNNCSGGPFLLGQACATFASTTVTVDNLSNTNAGLVELSFDEKLLAAAFAENGKKVDLSCKPWVNKILGVVTNNSMILPFQGANNYTWALNSSGRVEYRCVEIEKVNRADIIQFNMASKNNLPHTAIVAATTPTGMIWIHSNWQKTNTVSVDFITYAYFKYIAGSEYSVYHIK